MATHHLPLNRDTLHGAFSAEFPPALTVNSGDTVTFQTLDARWFIEPPIEEQIDPVLFEPRDPVLDSGHALCGPIAVRGAKPGMMLEIVFNEIRPASWGWVYAGGGYPAHNPRLGVDANKRILHRWELDVDKMIGRNQHGHQVALNPFMGVIGMPPAPTGIYRTTPPYLSGGNIDCKELVVGSRLFLPIMADGGLLSVGDGHAIQGDGEVNGVAIECPMAHGSMTLTLHEKALLTTPYAHTPAGWVTFGFNHDLNVATEFALSKMLDLMMQIHNLTRHDAYALASLVVDMRVTQIVNQVKGVHAIMSHDAFIV
ncbi:MAG: acetamidase/formamidase family protein [Candidatus Promineifilaceae bacterium]